MKRIAIIGGGISGLSAAFSLERHRLAGVPVDYVLYEATPRFGGVIRSERIDGFRLEAGPDSFLTEKPWAANLCGELGIKDQLIGSNDSERRTYILVDGKLISMPDGMAFMVPTKLVSTFFSPLFSLPAKIQMLREWFHPPAEMLGDESVASFVKRHYGKEMVERVADPLLSGVYGGDAGQLSIQSVLPRFAKMQTEHGSLGKAMIKSRRKASDSAVRPLFTSLKNGMHGMVDAILRRLPPSCLRSNTPVHSVHRADDVSRKVWIISSSPVSQRASPQTSRDEVFDAVILALPAQAAAKLVAATSGALVAELQDISYSSSITVSLGYDETVSSKLPPGFGYLVPRTEGKRVMAVTFVHNKFPDQAPEGQALLRCFLGGTRDAEVLDLSEQEILGIVAEELEKTLGIRSAPLFERIYKWKAAMAQYNVGHTERLRRIEILLRGQSGLFLAGNAYSGIGIPDCVRSGTESANKAVLLACDLAPTQGDFSP